MIERRSVRAVALVLLLLGAAAFAQQAGEAVDLSGRVAELQARAQRLSLLAQLPPEARPEAEELLGRYEDLARAEQELEVARLEALVAALEGGDSPSVAQEVAGSAVAEGRVSVTRQREALQADVEAFVERYPEAAAVLRSARVRAVGLGQPEVILSGPGGVGVRPLSIRVMPGAGGIGAPFDWPFEGLRHLPQPRPGTGQR